MFDDMNDATLLAIWRAADSAVRKRKVQKNLPVGRFAIEPVVLAFPTATLTRKGALRAPTIHASPIAMAAFIGRKAGCVGPALSSLIVEGLNVAAAGDLHQSMTLAGVNEDDMKAVKKAIAAECNKVPMVRTSVVWG